MGQLQQDDIPPGRLLSLGPRPAAVDRGVARVRLGPVDAESLAAAMLDAHALLRAGATPGAASEEACGPVVARRWPRAKRLT